MEAFLHAKLMERRIRLSEANNSLVPSTVPGSLAGKLSVPSPVQQKCSFNITSSMKCGDVCIPMTKFCQKHILNDPNQVLFRTCGTVIHSDDQDYQNEDGPCETPIPDVFDSSTCIYHVQFQPPMPTSQAELDSIRKIETKEVCIGLFSQINLIIFMMRNDFAKGDPVSPSCFLVTMCVGRRKPGSRGYKRVFDYSFSPLGRSEKGPIHVLAGHSFKRGRGISNKTVREAKGRRSRGTFVPTEVKILPAG